jgi:uncharacterized protein
MNIFCAERVSLVIRTMWVAERSDPGMNIVVAQISEDEGLSLEYAYPEGEPALAGEDTILIGRCQLNLQATRSGKEVELIGTVNAAVGFECDRCLKPLSVPIEQSFDLFYVPPMKAGDERELGADDLSTGFYQGEAIDLDDVVREQVELALPMARLCGEECQGLCPDCGANLNDGRCACEANRADERWAALSELKSKLN